MPSIGMLFLLATFLVCMEGFFEISRAQSILGKYNLGKPDAIIACDASVSEVSGLALTEDGRLFCHNDESAVVYQIDPQKGSVIKRFRLGKLGVTGDFEGIAIVGKTFWLTTSSGDLYAFREGSDNAAVDFQRYTTPLDAEYDVEGLCYDPATNALLLACKGSAGKGFKEYRAVYSFSLSSKTLEKKPRFLIAKDKAEKDADGGEFKPSGIERSREGTFFVLANRGLSLVELSSDGKVLAQAGLPKKIHRQPEGIALAADGTLYIANESAGKKAMLVMYRPGK